MILSSGPVSPDNIVGAFFTTDYTDLTTDYAPLIALIWPMITLISVSEIRLA
jgi:hypothetical protein